MTNREFFETIASIETLDQSLRDFAKASAEKIVAKNLERSSKPSKAAMANAELAQTMFARMEVGKKYAASDLAVLMDFKTSSGVPSTSKATAVVKVLVEDGTVSVADEKVPKKGTCKIYTLHEPFNNSENAE